MSVRILLILFIVSIGLYPAQAATYKTQEDMAGEIAYYVVKPDDTLYQIARRFDIGIIEIMAGNPNVDPLQPEEGKELIIPTAHVLPVAPREGIVINLSELRLYYYRDSRTVLTFPISIGKEGWPTPAGTTIITKKREHPIWIPPDTIHEETPGLPEFIPAGPDNPLGDYALNLDWPGYVIHGTNRPYSIGARVSHGCIRLYPEDISILFKNINVGTTVTIVDQPYKLGWWKDQLILEVSPTQRQSDEILKDGRIKSINIHEVETAIARIIPEDMIIDWRTVEKAVKAPTGIPMVISWDGKRRLND